MLKNDLGRVNWINRRSKKAALVAVVFLFLLSLSIFNVKISLSLVLVAFMGLFVLMTLTLEEEVTDIIRNLGYSATMLVVIVIIGSWIFKYPVPFIKLEMTDNSVMAIFTIILGITSILGYNWSKKAIGLSRLTNLKVMLKKNLEIQVTNKGNFDARGLRLEIDIKRKAKTKLFKERFLKNAKEMFFIQEPGIHLLSSKESILFPLSTLIKEVVGIDIKKKDKLKGKAEFFVNIILSYHSDTYFKNPIPLCKTFHVTLINDKIKILEYLPYWKFKDEVSQYAQGSD